jgi:hypothetical protein
MKPVHVRPYTQRRSESVMKSRPIYKALARAYADTSPDLSNEERMDAFGRSKAYKIRNLDFRGSWTSDKELAKLLVERVGPYNNFNPASIKEFIDTLPEGTSVRVGREGSPVMYFRYPEGLAVSQLYNQIEDYSELLQYDELDYTSSLSLGPRYSVDKIGAVRVWWD